MSEVIAKPVVKNKFWIVEEDGHKIATIQAVDEGGVVYVHNNERETFPSIKLLTKKYNIEFVKAEKSAKSEDHEVYGYPCSNRPQNEIYDVQRKLPLYTKSGKSKSYFCAGYYAVKFSNTWVKAYCPKLITLNRYDYIGPFKTQEEQQQELRRRNGHA
jgi:hypothetical protein